MTRYIEPDTVDNYYVLVLSVAGRAQDKAKEKVQLLTGMLLSFLSYRFTGDAPAAIEAFERCVREYEGQSIHVVPDFVKAGVVINGIEEQALRDHFVMHSARQEVFDVATAKIALGTASTSSPMEVDALRRDKGKAKGKNTSKAKSNRKNNSKKKKHSQETVAEMLQLREARPQEVGVVEARSRQDQVDLARKAKNINELGATSSAQAAQQNKFTSGG